jgi:replicative DNA helicase
MNWLGSPPGLANPEAEAALCGALMIDNGLVDRAIELVRPEDFADALLGRIFSACVRERDSGRAANPVTLRPYFDDDPAMVELGGPGFLARLTGSGMAIIGALDFARQIGDLARRRRFHERLTVIAGSAEDWQVEVGQLAADAEAAISELVMDGGEGVTLSASKAIEQALAGMNPDAPGGVTCGLIPTLDFYLGPVRPGNLAILAGRPAMGKTALGLSYAHGAARKGDGVLFASLEMTAEELGGRLACDLAYEAGHPVPYDMVTSGKATPRQRQDIARAAIEARGYPLVIEDLPTVTIGRLAAIVRREKRRFALRGTPLKLVVVDYLQLLRPNREERSNYENITAVSRGLKALAKSEGVGVLALCQLSREVEKREKKRPILPDLKGSGDIEQDADVVCFVYRVAEYLARNEPEPPDSPEWVEWSRELARHESKIEFIVAKRRGGRTGVGHGLWLGAFQAVRG